MNANNEITPLHSSLPVTLLHQKLHCTYTQHRDNIDKNRVTGRQTLTYTERKHFQWKYKKIAANTEHGERECKKVT